MIQDKLLAALWVGSYALIIRIFAALQVLDGKQQGARQKPM
jgi:hypothetical protein